MNANSQANGRLSAFAFAWFFCILGGYYVIRPIRDTMGVASGRDSLNWLFLATFVAMVVAVPVYAACVARLSRRLAVGVVYRFFIANLLVFWLALQSETPEIRVWVARAFFVWASVFGVYATSVFWSVLADLFDSDDAKRSFGFIAAGGTTGAIVGSAVASALSTHLSTHNLLLIPVVLLEVGLWFASRLQRQVDGRTSRGEKISSSGSTGEATGGGLLDGVIGVAKSKYLLAICASLVLGQLCGTYLYMQQATIVGAAIEDEAGRTSLFSQMNLATQILTLILQASTTRWLAHRAGLTMALIAAPIAYAVMFATLGIAPTLAVFAIGDVIRRGLIYGVTVPAREVLFTVVSREDKYKSKGFIDTVIFRGGDAISSQILAGAKYLFASPAVIQLAMIPVALVWTGMSVWLAYHQKALSKMIDKQPA